MSLILSPKGAKVGPLGIKWIGVEGAMVTKKASYRPTILKGGSFVVTNSGPS
jgi:hypothetical protein